MSLSVWLAFLLAAILIAMSPGPGAAASMSAGMRFGYRSAVRVIGGLQTALVIQLTVVALGLGALLLTSKHAFDAVKLLGAAYLIWLGIQKWRSPPEEIDAEKLAIAAKGLFMEGLLVNLTNPKAIVFIAALTPQFIDPNRPQLPQFLIIALTMCITDTLVMSDYALLASRLGACLHGARARRAQDRFFGGLFIGAGALLATSSRN